MAYKDFYLSYNYLGTFVSNHIVAMLQGVYYHGNNSYMHPLETHVPQHLAEFFVKEP